MHIRAHTLAAPRNLRVGALRKTGKAGFRSGLDEACHANVDGHGNDRRDADNDEFRLSGFGMVWNVPFLTRGPIQLRMASRESGEKDEQCNRVANGSISDASVLVIT